MVSSKWMARCLGIVVNVCASFYQLPSSVVKSESSSSASSKSSDAAALDQLTRRSLYPPTTGERSARVRSGWPLHQRLNKMAEVFRELSHKMTGAAKPSEEAGRTQAYQRPKRGWWSSGLPKAGFCWLGIA